MTALPVPDPSEYAPFYHTYIERAAARNPDVVALLAEQRSTIGALGALPAATAEHAYAPGKWTVKELLGHVTDGERIFTYRALRFARGDTTPLPGFDENVYVPAGRYDRRTIGDIAGELLAVREATLAFYRTVDAEQGARQGPANGTPCSVRALAWITAGHFVHHTGILAERYGVTA